MKTILITGCSSGFGRELVQALLSQGHRVIASLRNSETRRELFTQELLNTERFTLLTLDVCSAKDRENAAQLITQKFDGKLDVLINNAGFGLFGALENLEESQIREQMEVNFFGLTLLTQSMLPALRKARGKVINLSSVLGFSAIPLTSLYCASKYAVEGLSEALAYELAPHGVQVTLVEPGAHKTQFGSSVQWGRREIGSVYRVQTENYRRIKELVSQKSSSPASNVTRTIVRLIEAPRMPLRSRCGRDAHFTALLKRLLGNALSAALFSFVYGKLFLRPIKSTS